MDVESEFVVLYNNYTRMIDNLIHIAAQNGYKEIVKLIISIGGKSVLNVQNQSGNTPLHMAVEYERYASSKALIDAGALSYILILFICFSISYDNQGYIFFLCKCIGSKI